MTTKTTNVRTAANRFLVPTAALDSFEVILAVHPKFAALTATRHDRADGASYASVVLNDDLRADLFEAMCAVAGWHRPMRTAARRFFAACECTSQRFWGIAARVTDQGVFTLGLKSRTGARVSPTGRLMAA